MSNSESEIRQRHQQEKNETPALAGGGGGDGGDQDGADDGGDQEGGHGVDVPIPSMSKKHVAVIALIVGLLIAYKLHQRQQESESLGSAKDKDWSSDVPVEGEGDDEEDDIYVPANHDDPMAGDEAVTEYFRTSGKLSGD